MTKISPFLPVISRSTKFQPVFVEDVAKAIIKLQKDIINSIKNNKYIKNLIKKSWGQEIFDIRLYYKKSIKKKYSFLKIPQIAEAAAFAVPAKDHGQEDEVMVALMIIKGSKIEYSKWINKVSADLAKFAIPLYLRVMKNFPKTQTGKIQKNKLRAEGVTIDTWQNKNI